MFNGIKQLVFFVTLMELLVFLSTRLLVYLSTRLLVYSSTCLLVYYKKIRQTLYYSESALSILIYYLRISLSGMIWYISLPDGE